jgi:hypothetical protein
VTIVTRRIALAALMSISLAGCGNGTEPGDTSASGTDGGDGDVGDGDGTSGDGDGTTGDGDGAACDLSGIDLTIRSNPDSTIAPFADVTMPGSAQARVDVYRAGALVAERDATTPEIGTAWLWGLSADAEYEAEAVVTCGPDQAISTRVTFQTGPLPSGVPSPQAVVDDPTRAHRGLVFFPTATGSRLVYVGVDHTGEIVWYYDMADFTQSAFAGDLQPLADGRLLLTRRNGLRIIEPWGEMVNDLDVDFHHDLIALPNGNFLAINDRDEMFNVPALGGDVTVSVDGIIEIDSDGTEVRQWWGSDHLDTQRFPTILSQNTTMGGGLDWMHANGLYWDEATSRVLMSIRHQNWMIAIDWPSGDVAWTLGFEGDFSLAGGGAEDWFYAPHAPELQAGGASILLYDNGNERPTPDLYSRGIEIGFDVTAGTAEVLWESRIEPITPSFGDTDRLPSGHVLVCAGGVPSTGPDPARIIEYDGSDIVWDLHTERTYRATYLDGF